MMLSSSVADTDFKFTVFVNGWSSLPYGCRPKTK